MSSHKCGKHSQDNLESAPASLQACLVDGDPTQLTRARLLRRRSLVISVFAQIVILAALILVPL
ncbi:MAG: hypothetical protein M3P45_09710, partial [Acidobacteriota bacterium]|nr:hypothetical protein [Acidobacteriota bacterium]